MGEETQKKSVYYEQNLLEIPRQRIKVTTFHECDPDLPAAIEDLLGSLSEPQHVGLGWANTQNGIITVFALASPETVIFIQLSGKKSKNDPALSAARQHLEDRILCDPQVVPCAFHIGRLALSLWNDKGLHMQNGVNIQSACTCRDPHKVTNAVSFAVECTDIVAHPRVIDDAFHDFFWDPTKKSSERSLAFRAWLAAYIPCVGDMQERFRDVPFVDTRSIPEAQLQALAQVDRGDQRLDDQKSDTTKNEITFVRAKDNPCKALVKSERFQNRLRYGTAVRITVRDQSGYEYSFHGRTGDTSGQRAEIIATPPFTFEDKAILDITTVSYSDPTQAEVQRDQKILTVLQHLHTLYDNPFLQLIWPSDSPVQWPLDLDRSDAIPPLVMDPERPMNTSQKKAVRKMLKLDDDHRITLVQGPPGTGKTTVIATFVKTVVEAGHTGIWLIAQSNVAVKNIAEKLDASDFDNWKLLVSKDFHFEWHDHLYRGIASKIIRSDDFKLGKHNLSKIKVILCTLSMLSNSRIGIFTKSLPIKFLVVDEASQIKVSDYISPVLSNSTICKICFIGDDKQLPPFGQEEIEDIESIFERKHLRLSAEFLDRQYRMPPQIGEFISDAVYEGQLSSNPKHPQADNYTCFFVDVRTGTEISEGTSFTNPEEVAAVVRLAAHLQEASESYRIITPYDAQRSCLEESLKHEQLVWQNKCFNVDSFQGNEDEIIILSLVRTDGLGFLTDLRRTNVMLTRCKQALYVCSSRRFLSGLGVDSLVGRMAAAFGEEAWIDLEDVEAGNF